LFRHQIAGLIATAVDFGALIILTEVFGLWYVYSTATGALLGAITNFFISSYWAFSGSKNSLVNQMWKYIIVSAGSLVLNTLFVYLLTDFLNFDYKISKVITAITIAWTYNFLLMRYYVFKK
jgi:putative flippase GtrA